MKINVNKHRYINFPTLIRLHTASGRRIPPPTHPHTDGHKVSRFVRSGLRQTKDMLVSELAEIQVQNPTHCPWKPYECVFPSSFCREDTEGGWGPVLVCTWFFFWLALSLSLSLCLFISWQPPKMGDGCGVVLSCWHRFVVGMTNVCVGGWRWYWWWWWLVGVLNSSLVTHRHMIMSSFRDGPSFRESNWLVG